MAADCSDPSDVLVISAEHPADVDAAGLRNSTPALRRPAARTG